MAVNQMRWVGHSALLLALAGCAPTVVVQPTMTAADISAAHSALEPGASLLKGSALLRQQGGGVVTCAGNPVYLVPATESASPELVRAFGGEVGFVRAGGADIIVPEQSRQGLCDPQGFFRFDKVRAGKWHILASVVWAVGYSRQGGTLLTTTTVPDAGEAEVVLTY